MDDVWQIPGPIWKATQTPEKWIFFLNSRWINLFSLYLWQKKIAKFFKRWEEKFTFVEYSEKNKNNILDEFEKIWLKMASENFLVRTLFYAHCVKISKKFNKKKFLISPTRWLNSC
jgi:hypothetical protein